MNTRQSLFTGLFFSILTTSSLAQTLSQIALRLSFNAEANRYQVIATPSFSARNFTWGPSQVSVVVPAEVADQTLSLRSLVAGSWSDNSIVFGPASASTNDFHGLSSQGDKLDLVAGQDYVLFDFGLPGGYIPNVRLYDETKDPGSEQNGMKGGDFSCYMADERGTNYVRVNTLPALLTVQAQEVEPSPETAVQMVAYPNPSSGGTFRLYLKGFSADEVVTVQLLNTNGVVLRSFAESVSTLAGRKIDAGESSGYSIIKLNRQVKPERLTQKIWFR